MMLESSTMTELSFAPPPPFCSFYLVGRNWCVDLGKCWLKYIGIAKMFPELICLEVFVLFFLADTLWWPVTIDWFGGESRARACVEGLIWFSKELESSIFRLLLSISMLSTHLLCRQSVLIFQQSQTLSNYFMHLRCTGITGVERQVTYTCILCVWELKQQ